MKFLRSISLILCLVGPYMTIFIYLHYERYQTKREIKHSIIEGIDKSELVKLVFTDEELANEVTWEHSKEFEYKGEMYDVVETAKEDGKTVYWVWWDHEETSLNKKLNYLLAIALGDTNVDPDKHEPVSLFMKMFYTLPEQMLVIVPSEIIGEHYSDYKRTEGRATPEIPSPPPRPYVS